MYIDMNRNTNIDIDIEAHLATFSAVASMKGDLVEARNSVP